MTAPIALESIMSCFRGVIPSPFATCSADGTPNVTYMSVVHYVDGERVALSRQFFNKTAANLQANPASQVRVVDPETLEQYELDLEYLHTEREGATFEAMRTALAAIASQTEMESVFRLRGVDVHKVVRCARAGASLEARPERASADVLAQLDELTRRLAACDDYEAATAAALRALDDLFGFRHAILLVHDREEGRLFAVADNGYGAEAAGAEIGVGEGVIGTAVASGRVVCVPNLARARVMQAAVRGRGSGTSEDPATAIPLPGLDHAQSVAAVPLVARNEVAGALYLESERSGTFGPHTERLLRVVGAHLAAALRGFDGDARDRPSPVASPVRGGPSRRVTYYQADDSVFVDDRYVVKGMPGRILWKLLREHAADGRTAFTNRELRLDERLGLPAGSDNLEARLLVLRKRLAGGGFGLELERVGRGQLELRTAGPFTLSEVGTRGPMRSAHA